jgi:hypothetical protein
MHLLTLKTAVSRFDAAQCLNLINLDAGNNAHPINAYPRTLKTVVSRLM